ncbi:MAG: tetratricopeptide repeat protein [Gammaproteobacteria bacterium]
MRMHFNTSLACAALVLAGCAAAPARSPSAAHPASSAAFSTPEQALTYHVFMGELALQRGESEIAAGQYARAAQSSVDPTLAEQATILAYQAGDDRLALELSQRWRTLAPKDKTARHFEAILNTRMDNVDAAVSEFESLLRDVPGENLAVIGQLLGEEADAGQALPVMRKLAAARPQSAEAHFALGRLALHYSKPTLAIDESRRALAIKPGWDEAVVLEARALVAAGQNSEALMMLKARAQAEPGNTGLHLAYGALLAQAGQNTQSQTEFTAILGQHPRNPEALYYLGLLALQANQLTQAHGYFMRLLGTGQRNNDAWFFLGNTAELSKQYPEALRRYQQVDGGEHWLSAQIGIARVLIEQGKPNAAREYIDNIAAADPDDAVQFRLAEAQLFSNAGDNQTALKIFDQALAENPDNGDLLYGRALLQDTLGNAVAAESDLHIILSRQPDNADALNALGYTLAVHSTRYQEARIYIEKALQLKPDDPAIIDSMGWVEYRLGNYPQALDYLRKAYAQLADPEVAAHLTEALWAAGDKQEARGVWSSALRQHPEDPTLLKLGPRFSP